MPSKCFPGTGKPFPRKCWWSVSQPNYTAYLSLPKILRAELTAVTEFGRPGSFKILADFNILTALQYRLGVASAILAPTLQPGQPLQHANAFGLVVILSPNPLARSAPAMCDCIWPGCNTELKPSSLVSPYCVWLILSLTTHQGDIIVNWLIVQLEYCSKSWCSICTCSNRFLDKRHYSKVHVQIFIVQLTWKENVSVLQQIHHAGRLHMSPICM